MSPVDDGATALWKGYRRRPGVSHCGGSSEPLWWASGLSPDLRCFQSSFLGGYDTSFQSPMKCWWNCFRDMVWSWWPELSWFPCPFIWGTSWSHICGVFPIKLAQMTRNLTIIFQSPLHVFDHRNLETLCSWVIWAPCVPLALWRPDAPMWELTLGWCLVYPPLLVPVPSCRRQRVSGTMGCLMCVLMSGNLAGSLLAVSWVCFLRWLVPGRLWVCDSGGLPSQAETLHWGQHSTI